MWKKLDPSKITSNVCMQCAACCKHTVRYTESKERYAKNKLEYLMAMHEKPKEDFWIQENDKGKWVLFARYTKIDLILVKGLIVLRQLIMMSSFRRIGK